MIYGIGCQKLNDNTLMEILKVHRVEVLVVRRRVLRTLKSKNVCPFVH
jgi:hypothetical protein